MGRGLNHASRLVVPDAPTDADRAAIVSGLAAFNRAHVDLGATGPLAVLIRDDAGGTVGGLWGTTLFHWLRIDLLFVPHAMRGASLGQAVMARAEAVAAARGCIGASLDTYSFQARGFYEKLGYELVGTIDDFPPGGARHFLKKRFA
ncbi:MAG TPA: GNAT family N-acetyltransferase [Sphingomonadaceae bacterium]|nr:GNAT family N-acetyltransferase [Sphingomonadaceae bacterium]